MTWPPSILRVELKGGSRDFRFWLPLFAAWPFVLLAAVILAPLILALAIILWWTGWGRSMLRAGPVFYGILCALKGLQIDVRKRNKHVHLSFR